MATFHLFGITHLLTILSLTGVIFFLVHGLQKRNKPEVYQKYHVLLGFLLLAEVAFWRIPLLLENNFSIGYDLPLHLCGLSQILLVIYLWTGSRLLYDILFYWIITGSTLGVLIPDLQVGFPSFQFFSMFLSHTFSLAIMLYLFFVQGKRPRDKSYHTAIWAMVFYGFVILLPLDLLIGGNYLYMLEPPEVNFFLIRYLPPWPWYWPVLFAFFYLFFKGLYLQFARTFPQSQKKEEYQV